MNVAGSFCRKDLVLLGGGHAHVEVLRSFGMRPVPGVRLTLITKDVHTAYSGMLPGFVARYYSFDECHIDLSRLATFAKAQFVNAEAVSIDPKTQVVHLRDREPVAYDVLSIDVGITPSGEGVPGALKHATPVKPVSSFVNRLQTLRDRHAKMQRPIRVVVVGGGAGGVELAMSLHHSLQQPAGSSRDAQAHAQPQVTVVSRGKILSSHPPAARRKFLRIMKEKGMSVKEGCAVKAVTAGKLVLGDTGDLEFDECLWCTQAGAADWLRDTGLPLGESGFIAIGDTLQCHPGPANVFAVGDCATSVAHPRPKAGVFAVRQGPPLTANIRRFLAGEQLRPFKPQATFLGLITTGDKYAIATKGWLCIEGAFLWSWKDKIDRAFMHKYGRDLPQMDTGSRGESNAASSNALVSEAAVGMRCGGCGSKVGSSVLTRTLSRLPSTQQPDNAVLAGLEARDDAAVTRPPPPGCVLVHSLDFFRSFISDPFVFGSVAANHALGDCFAMGAAPRTALALAVVPYGDGAKVEETLFQMLAGAARVLGGAGCALVGGHTCEGPDACLGFAVDGYANEEALLRKGGALPGQALVLTKALGTGVIMAASMRAKAKGRWVQGAIGSMQQSSRAAADCLKAYGATSCTDVTGFGLLGHLQEIALASQVGAEVTVVDVPLLAGAAECSAAGIASSLLPQNAQIAPWIHEADAAAGRTEWPLLLDPQTAAPGSGTQPSTGGTGGGLLASVPADKASACVAELVGMGYSSAAVIGKVVRMPGRVEDSRPMGLIPVAQPAPLIRLV